jgi:hypothetical protein
MEEECWNQYELNFMVEEINLHISWNSKKATDILVQLTRLLGSPNTLNLNQNGLAHFIKYNIAKKTFYEREIIWDEIMIQDEYIYDNVNNVKNLKPLYCYYKKQLTNGQIIRLCGLNVFNIWYDNNKNSICINTDDFLEAHYNIKIILDILSDDKIDITKYNTYLKSIREKYKTKKEINALLYKIHSFQL